MRKIYTSQEDWSAKIIPNATLADLDAKAIALAREKYKQKNPVLAVEVDTWNNELFLDKAKITLDGKITNTAILLLGTSEASALISPAIAKISWILKTEQEDYEHFFTPFILTIDQTLACIRNLKYRYMVDDNTLFPKEVKRYDDWVMREALHNAIAHQDYSQSSRIIVLEYNNRLLIENAGGFIPNSVEEAIHYNRPQRYYRNPFLVSAMVNLNMIDTIGSGIKKMFAIQRERFFPLPTYNISDKEHTEVTIHGELIDITYTNVLFKNPELPMDDVIALDKVQKKQPLTQIEIQRLRELRLVRGNDTTLEIIDTTDIPPTTKLSTRQQKIINYILEHGSISNAICQHLLDISKPTATRELQKMTSENLIKQEGTNKGTIYTLYQEMAHIGS